MKTSYGKFIRRTLIAFPAEAPTRPTYPLERLLVLSLKPLALKDFKEGKGYTGLISCQGEFINNFPDRIVRYIRQTIREQMDARRFDAVPPDVYDLYLAHTRQKGFPPKSKSELQDCMAFCVYEQGRPISGMFVLPSDPLLLLGIFSDGEQPKAAKRVMYEVCLWGHEHGYGAVDVNKLEEKEGLSNEVFKRSFGTVIVPRYRYVYQPTIYRLAFTMRESIQRIRWMTARREHKGIGNEYAEK